MKKVCIPTPAITLFSIFLLLISASSLQAGMAVGTDSPHSSAEAEISSSDKGILIPRMTAAQRKNIFEPADGLMVYQTDETTGFYYYDGVYNSGGSWRNLSGKIPSMSSAVISTRIPNPTTGQLIYQTDNTPGFYYYDGSAWLQLGASSGSSGPSLVFSNNNNAISVFPPLNVEKSIANLIVSVTTGAEIKIDYSFLFEYYTGSDWLIACEVRLYGNGTLKNTWAYFSDGCEAHTSSPLRESFSGTYVDMAANDNPITYELRVIVTTATNTTSMSAVSRNMNALVFE